MTVDLNFDIYKVGNELVALTKDFHAIYSRISGMHLTGPTPKTLHVIDVYSFDDRITLEQLWLHLYSRYICDKPAFKHADIMNSILIVENKTTTYCCVERYYYDDKCLFLPLQKR